jgi:hypothetical protein
VVHVIQNALLEIVEGFLRLARMAFCNADHVIDRLKLCIGHTGEIKVSEDSIRPFVCRFRVLDKEQDLSVSFDSFRASHSHGRAAL